MRTKTTLALVASLASLTLAVPASAATILSDSFEVPATPGYSYDGTDAAGAYFLTGSGIQRNGSAFGYANAPDGVQTAHLQGQGSFVYYLSGLVDGSYYTLSFDYAARPGYGVDGVQVSYAEDTDPVIFTGTPSSASFTSVSATFQYSGSGYAMLTFAGTTPQGADAGSNPASDFNVAIDKVSLTSAVPEPATWAMMLLGFGMVGAGLRHRRKSTTARLA